MCMSVSLCSEMNDFEQEVLGRFVFFRGDRVALIRVRGATLVSPASDDVGLARPPASSLQVVSPERDTAMLPPAGQWRFWSSRAIQQGYGPVYRDLPASPLTPASLPAIPSGPGMAGGMPGLLSISADPAQSNPVCIPPTIQTACCRQPLRDDETCPRNLAGALLLLSSSPT